MANVNVTWTLNFILGPGMITTGIGTGITGGEAEVGALIGIVAGKSIIVIEAGAAV